VAAELKTIYGAPTVHQTNLRFGEFEDKWGANYPIIVKSWRSNCTRLTPFFDYAPEIRRIIYTSNAIESVKACARLSRTGAHLTAMML
jgi:putative transposase